MSRSTPPEPVGALRAGEAPRPLLLAGLVAVVAAAVFAPAMGGGFILDDQQLIQTNPAVHSLAHWTGWFTTDLWDLGNAVLNLRPRIVYYRPLVTASYAVDWVVGHGSPVIFHVTNLVWYGAASGLAFLALRRWLGSWAPALVLALLLAVHPTRGESVAWISGRTDVMCATWMLLASAGIARRLRGGRSGIALEIVATLAAYLTKELAIVLPAFAAVEVWVHAGKPPLDAGLARAILRKAAPQLAIAVGYLVFRSFVLPITRFAGPNPTLSAPLTHVALVLETFGRAVVLAFAPHDLTIDEGPIRIEHGHYLYSLPYALGGVATLCAIAGLAWLARKRAPGVALGTLFFALTFLPTSNLSMTRLTTVISDRFLYVPLLGVALAVGCAVQGVPRRWWWWLGGLGVAAASLLAVSSVARARDFGDEHRFWEREATLNPDSQTAAANQLRLAVASGDARKAFNLSVKTYQLSRKYYSYVGYEIFYALETLDALARLTPDRNTARLRALADFHAQLLDASRRSARLELPELMLAIDTGNARTQARVRESEPRILVTRADLLSRIGDDTDAAPVARSAARACGICPLVAARAAIVLARASDYAAARRVMDTLAHSLGKRDAAPTRAILDAASTLHAEAVAPGARGVVARAKELAVLGAYGRAFAVLQPHDAELLQAPALVRGYAELAWRAGYFDVARHALAGRMPPASVKALEHAWSRAMGWEPPAGEDAGEAAQP